MAGVAVDAADTVDPGPVPPPYESSVRRRHCSASTKTRPDRTMARNRCTIVRGGRVSAWFDEFEMPVGQHQHHHYYHCLDRIRPLRTDNKYPGATERGGNAGIFGGWNYTVHIDLVDVEESQTTYQ